MGNIWRSFWYTGLIILLSAFNKNGNDALAGITMKKRIRRKGRTPLIPFQGQLQDAYSSIAMAEHPWKGHFLLTLGIYFIRTYFHRRLLYHLLSTNDDNTISWAILSGDDLVSRKYTDPEKLIEQLSKDPFLLQLYWKLGGLINLKGT